MKLRVDASVLGLEGRGVLVGSSSAQSAEFVLCGIPTPPLPPEQEGYGPEEWAVEHAAQVEEMLPGGLVLVGVFCLRAGETELKKSEFARDACESVEQPVVLSRKGGRQFFQSAGLDGSIRVLDHQAEEALFESVFSTYEAAARIRLVGSSPSFPLQAAIDQLVSGPIAIAAEGKVLRPNDGIGEPSAMMQIFLPVFPARRKSTAAELASEPFSVVGDVMLLACVPRKTSTVSTCLDAFKQDLTRSLGFRADLLGQEPQSPISGPTPMPARFAGRLDSIPFPISDYRQESETEDSARLQLATTLSADSTDIEITVYERTGPRVEVKKPSGAKPEAEKLTRDLKAGHKMGSDKSVAVPGLFRLQILLVAALIICVFIALAIVRRIR